MELCKEVDGLGDTEETEAEEEEEEEEIGEVREGERERGKNKRELKEQPGAGMSAGKRQWLAQDQYENLIQALEKQDEMAGKLYKETLTAGIDNLKLVEAIAKASQSGEAAVPGQGSQDRRSAEQRREERLTEQER